MSSATQPVTSHDDSTPFAPAPYDGAASRWAARVMTTIAALFLLMDGAMKVVPAKVVIETMGPLGWSASAARPIGITLLVCLALYLIPRTAVLGAILLTGFFGGAIATNARVGNPLFSHVLFPVYLGILVWGGLWLRDARVRALIPFRGTDR